MNDNDLKIIAELAKKFLITGHELLVPGRLYVLCKSSRDTPVRYNNVIRHSNSLKEASSDITVKQSYITSEPFMYLETQYWARAISPNHLNLGFLIMQDDKLGWFMPYAVTIQPWTGE